MRGAHVLIPARFMTLIGHLCVAITLLWEVKKSVGHCLPSQFHQEYFQTYHSRLAAGFAASIALILVELVTFIPGLTMFSSNVAMLSIGAHGSASIFLTYFVLDGGLLCDWFWPVFVLCSVLPSCVDIATATPSEHQQLTQSSEPKGGWSFYLIMAAVATTLGSSLPVGYNIGSVNMPAETIKSFCNDSFISRYDVLLDEGWMDVLWSSVVSIFIVGGCTGSLLGAVLANNLGRKKATIATSFLSLAGSVLFLFCRTANSVEMLVLGRLIVGLASGLTTTIVPMYLTELAPLSLTGTLGVVCPMGVNVGVLVAQVMGLDFLLGRPEDWPYLLSAYALLVMACVPALLVLPESPKYLFVVKRDEDFALEELSRLRGVSQREAGAGTEAAALRAEAEAEAGTGSGVVLWSVARVARSGRLRLPLALVCAMQAGQQTSGINAVFYYSGAIFAQAGLSADGARYATIGCGFVNVCTAILMLHLLPRVGRRPLLLFSVCSSVILLTALAVSMRFISAVSWMPFVCMIAVLGYVLVYGFGLGPIPYFIGSEIFEVAPRPAGMAWGSLANWGGNFLVGMSFPTMKAAIGSYSFLVFAAITFALFLFIKIYFPETRGKTPLQVTEVCSRGLRSRPLQDQRRSYV